ncbi:MAG: endo-1,4-beta-xylanase [Nanoarchaeota archaeon]
MDRRQFLLSSVGALVSAVTAKTGLDWRGKRLSAQETRIEEMVRGPSITLRSLADKVGIDIGAGGINTVPFYKDPDYKKIIAREFTSLTPADAMSFAIIHPRRGYGDERDYNFEHADAMLEFAEANKMRIRGQTLVYHNHHPEWLNRGSFNNEELTRIMEEHIYRVVGRYKGKLFAWDVVNEIFESIPVFQNISDYIPLAFQFAHKADPSARLFLNDNHNEGMNKKSDAIYELAKELLKRNIPLHGIGFQMHVSLLYPPDLKGIRKNIRRLGKLGLDVHITEMYVKTDTIDAPVDEKFKRQADIYRDITKVCLDEEACTSLATWGVTDRHSRKWQTMNQQDRLKWRLKWQTMNQQEKPLLFDEDYRAKPSYFAVKRGLAESYTS